MSYQSHFKKAKAARHEPVAPAVRKKNLTEAEVEAQLREAFGMDKKPANKKQKQKQKPKSKSMNAIYPIFGLMALFIGLSSYMIYPEFFDEIFDHIEIQAMTQANASSEEAAGKKAPPTKAQTEEKAASAESQGAVTADKKSGPTVPEDVSYLSKLKERQAALDLRETELNQLEEELQKQKVEIEKRIGELTQIREEIATKLEDRVQADEGKVKKLVDLYSSMKAKQAAKIIESINRDLAVEVLASMKKKSAAEVMNVMDEKVARELSERLAGYKRIPASTK